MGCKEPDRNEIGYYSFIERASTGHGLGIVDGSGYLAFRKAARAKTGEVPAFLFWTWQDGIVARLPRPQKAFGLFLGGTSIRDAGLKELAGLTSLQSLHIAGTMVTDAGLKELAGLKNLQSLYLSTKATDAGMKELAGLKSLQC